ncbi:MAG: hypothetical protein C4289_17540, partial [Chloroflexota bacterium]
VLIGLTGLSTPAAFTWLQGFYRELHLGLQGQEALAGLARMILAFGILLVPTSLMGATLPIIIRSSMLREQGFGANISLLYACNTAGAIVGCFTAGFVLIGGFGTTATNQTAATINIAVGVAAVLLSLVVAPVQGRTAEAAGGHEGAAGSAVATPYPALAVSVVFWAYGISGGISLAYEVVWSRVLALFFNSSIYAFTLMLTTVLLGIALGSYLVTPLMGRRFNWVLVFGLIATYGASSLVTVKGQSVGMTFALRQLVGVAVGGCLLLSLSRTDYYRWRFWAWPLLLVTLGLLLVPLLPFTRAIAPSVNGARRWIDLGPLNLQPSELARITVVVWCAMLASKKGEQVREFKKGVLPFILVLGTVSLLIALEPNLSMATLVALLGGLVLFTSGAKIGHFVLLAAGGVLLVFHQIRDAQYRLARLLTFLNPGEGSLEGGFQIHQSLVGIGSGRLVGVGLGEGQQKLGYLPYAYSDFLFSTIGEEWGFVGVVTVVGLFALFCWLGFRIARTAADPACPSCGSPPIATTSGSAAFAPCPNHFLPPVSRNFGFWSSFNCSTTSSIKVRL